MGTATLLRDISGPLGPRGSFHTYKDERHYRLAPPLADYSRDEDETARTFEFVVVSAVQGGVGMGFTEGNSIYGLYETYIFGANANGDITYWGELPGSQKLTLSHEHVLSSAGAGYTIVESVRFCMSTLEDLDE